MTETVIIALISLFGSLLGTLGGIMTSSKLTNYRLEQLEKKVAEHNNLVSRTYALEVRNDVFQEKIGELSQKLDTILKKGELHEHKHYRDHRGNSVPFCSSNDLLYNSDVQTEN